MRLEGVADGHHRRALLRSAWRRDARTLTRVTPHSVIVSTEAAPTPVRVSGVAFAIWLCIDDALTADELVVKLGELSDAPTSAMEAAVLIALSELAELGAVVHV